MGAGDSSPPTLGTPLEAKGKEEERGERSKKKREEEEGVPLVLGLGHWCLCAVLRVILKDVCTQQRRIFRFILENEPAGLFYQ